MNQDTVKIESKNPQNPYESFLVTASAGSGKTYQLSRRFLFLVGAGAKPDKILTVTFTKKAAGEMKARILEDATHLLASESLRASFEEDLQKYWYNLAPQNKPAPPLSALATAEAILGATQRLKISTIDSLFHDWVAKFTFEAQGDQGNQTIPSPFSLMETFESKDIQVRAWQATCRLISKQLDDKGSHSLINLQALPEQSVQKLLSSITKLEKMQTSLWYQKVTSGEIPIQFLEPPFSEHSHEEEFLTAFADAFKTIIAVIKKDDHRSSSLEALGTRSFQALIEARILTKDFTINKATFKGKTREPIQYAIDELEPHLLDFSNAQKINTLNTQGQAIYSAFEAYLVALEHLKNNANLIDFNDLIKGVFRLFHSALGIGARFLINQSIHHILLDEFQDTSILQWDVFKQLCLEMASGANALDNDQGLASTIFIVGDEKQSIYGFREADPLVMARAAKELSGRINVYPMSKSYRTSQVILDAVNTIFTSKFDDFQQHQTASFDDTPFVPNTGRFEIAPLCQGISNADATLSLPEITPAEQEAQLIAKFLQEALTGVRPYPIYDKGSQTYRPLKPSDCCILYRSTTKSYLFEIALRDLGIPSMRAEERGFFARPEISDAISLLKFMTIPADALSLMNVLKSPLGRITDEESIHLWKTTLKMADSSRSMKILTALKGLSPECRDLSERLISIANFSHQHSPRVAFSKALQLLDGFYSYNQESSEGQLAIKNLQKMVELVGGLHNKAIYNLVDVISHLDILASQDEVGFAKTNAEAVSLMTVHKSKGLEFPLVIVADSARPWAQEDSEWVKETSDLGKNFYYIGSSSDAPKNFSPLEKVKDSAITEFLAETNRLLYVGLTRAKQYLLVTAHEPARSGKGIKESAPFTTICESFNHDGNSWYLAESSTDQDMTAVDAEKPTAYICPEILDSQKNLGWELELTSPSSIGEKQEKTIYSGLREDISIYAQPMGDFVHAGLEHHVKNQTMDHAFTWDSNIAAHQLETSDPITRNQAFIEAQDHLKKILDNKDFKEMIAQAEILISEPAFAYQEEGAMVGGKIDLLVIRDNHIRIIDYKTTVLDSYEEPTLKKFARERAYDTQLLVYKKAIEQIYPNHQIHCEILFTACTKFIHIDI